MKDSYFHYVTVFCRVKNETGMGSKPIKGLFEAAPTSSSAFSLREIPQWPRTRRSVASLFDESVWRVPLHLILQMTCISIYLELWKPLGCRSRYGSDIDFEDCVTAPCLVHIANLPNGNTTLLSFCITCPIQLVIAGTIRVTAYRNSSRPGIFIFKDLSNLYARVIESHGLLSSRDSLII